MWLNCNSLIISADILAKVTVTITASTHPIYYGLHCNVLVLQLLLLHALAHRSQSNANWLHSICNAMYILTDKSVHARKCKDKINKIIKLNVEILFQKIQT